MFMSTTAISSASPQQQVQPNYEQQRETDLLQLGNALKSGDLNGAQAAYNAIVQLGQTVPGANGVPFKMANREQDFQAIGQALQAGDLAGATQALQALNQSFMRPQPSPAPTGSSSVGPDFVVNLSGTD
jgi:hypothetical protein